MTKALLNLPVLLAAVFSLAATVVISAWVFANDPRDAPGPTLMLDEPMAAPEFSVTDHAGEALTREDMLGRVWVCDFFLTRCGLVCPRLAMTVADVIGQIEGDASLDEVRFVSFSVDPEYDTVAQLRTYRGANLNAWSGGDEAHRAAIESRWRHARAEDQQAFWDLVSSGFKLYVGPSEGDPTTPIAHSSRLVLIDRRGNIRGYYDGLTEQDIPALLADIRRLVEAGD